MVSTGAKSNESATLETPILVAIGANLAGPDGAPPIDTCRAAIAAMPGHGIAVLARSRWYRSAPVPPSGQPDFVNAVVRVETGHGPEALLAELHRIEDRLGRARSVPNAARAIDLDLIAYGRELREPNAAGGLVLPHPRLRDRAFVLLPIGDLDPGWRHPATGATLPAMIAGLPPGQRCEPIE